jgi:hypothetical protein
LGFEGVELLLNPESGSFEFGDSFRESGFKECPIGEVPTFAIVGEWLDMGKDELVLPILFLEFELLLYQLLVFGFEGVVLLVVLGGCHVGVSNYLFYEQMKPGKECNGNKDGSCWGLMSFIKKWGVIGCLMVDESWFILLTDL